MHDARSVANQLIRRGLAEQKNLTPMQVQKLVYFCHAWMLALCQRPLIEQPIEAWRYGPVVPDVYRSLRRYGGEPVRREIPDVQDREFDHQESSIIAQVFDLYSDFNGPQLSAMTHAVGTPWDQIWTRYGRSFDNAVIPDTIIEDYYAAEAQGQGQR